MTDENKQEDIEEELEDSEHLLPVIRENTSLARLDPLSAYLNEIRQYEGLSEKEEKELAIRFREDGDLKAAYRMTTSHLTLVVRIAMGYRREWQNIMDLIQEGNVGLMKAVKNFDPFRGVRLSAYATWWIKSYILKYILDNWRLVKVGTTNVRRKLLYNLGKEKEKLEREGFIPTTKLLAERFGVDEEEVIDVQASLGASDVSVDTPAHDGDSTPLQTLAHHDSPETHVEISQLNKILMEKIELFKKKMKPIEIELVENRILSDNPRSLQAIGDEYKITREAVRQAEQRLLKKLKGYLEKQMPEAAEYFKK